MRCLSVVQLLPALNAGGVEQSTLEIGAALVAAGHRSIVISAGGRLLSQLLAQGSEHMTVPVGKKSLATLRHIWTLRRLFSELQPDIVHVRSRLPAWLAYRALRGMCCQRPHFVTTVHGRNSPSRYSAIMTRGERVICVSETMRDYVLRHYPGTDSRRLCVITRGIAPEEFPFGYQPIASWREKFFLEFPQLTGAPLLTLSGRGTRLKGHHDAIRLLSDLKTQGYDARLVLLGAREPGREAYIAELEQFAASLGVSERIAITAPRADVRDVYAISALVLQLSNKPESFGRTVIEALSLGRSVLGYAHGGVGELLAELFPAGAVPLRDQTALLARASELLRAAPTLLPLTKYRLADMQAATLRLYAELVG